MNSHHKDNNNNIINIFNSLLHEVFLEIRSYLVIPDWNRFVNACKLFRPIKRSTVCFNLSTMHSAKYLQNNSFRANVLGRIESTRHQLGLNLNNKNMSKLPAASELSDLYKLKIFEYDDLSYLSTLHNVYEVDLTGFRSIKDVKAFGKVYKLNLSGCHGILDVSALGSVHDLNLSYCKSITDVSGLGNDYALNLYGCENISDVSALGNVHDLNLSYCKFITDVSGLGNVYKLHLSGLENISDVSALGNVEELHLPHCSNILDILPVRFMIYLCSVDSMIMTIGFDFVCILLSIVRGSAKLLVKLKY
jgi:hypothetical protein